jgi:molybdopterin-guanine dinucleotide biosynthesis protein A
MGLGHDSEVTREISPGPAKGITGVILAGGRSSRLGFDKGRIVFGGEDLITRLARLMGLVTGRVVIVGREHENYESWPDDVLGAGPVGAITTALRRAGAPCFVMACDMPFMDEKTLRVLIRSRGKRIPSCLMTAYANMETGVMESLAAIYEPGALPYFEYCLSRLLLKTRLVVPEEFQNIVHYGAGETLPFFGINSPSDLAAAKNIFGNGVARNVLRVFAKENEPSEILRKII